MPLDATGSITEVTSHAVAVTPNIDPLAELQIVPVAKTVYLNHKKKISRMYSGQFYPSARWETVQLRRPYLRQQLAKLPIGSMAHDRSAAPEPVIRLAERVARHIKSAEFAVEYFYTDPILNVTYQHAGRVQVACLGIWDKGDIVAIADEVRPRKQSLFARWFGWR